MPEQRKCVMISSTARDLPEHRKEVMDACLRQGMFPVMMEHLPASDADAIRVSMELVSRADIYLLIIAHRYGTVLDGHKTSITEMEYDAAIERKLPRLCFVIDKDHPIKIEDVDVENAAKLKAFKERVLKENTVNFFKSPAELRGNVIDSLSNYREADITQFHFVSDIPAPPEAYVAHPYTLLQTHRLIGRQTELNLLTEWVTGGRDVPWNVSTDTRIMNIVAIGGMGKSALTWKWFNDIAPLEMVRAFHETPRLAGRMWWSFYESDASFENFVIRALAYVTKQSREEVQKISPPERETQLLAALDREPFLIVLDGLERILLAYARMDAARIMTDDEGRTTEDETRSSSVVGHPSTVRLRKTADPRAGAFLRKLANVRAARILVSTRLYPADLQTATGEPANGCYAIFLRGLNDDDALNLWRAFNVSGSRETLLLMFRKFENHPLLMHSLASEVANYRRAPGDFERWQKEHPNFNPFNLSLVNARTHVLEFALRGLDDKVRNVLETIAAFRMPASYDTLAALFIGAGKLFPAELGLDIALKELEDRGLLGWDKRANRYDLHPIVRGVVWSGLPTDTRSGVFTSLQAHFESVPKIGEDEVNSLEDLTPMIELYNTLIGLGRYDDAWEIFWQRLRDLILTQLGTARQSAELLEMLFADGLDNLPNISDNERKGYVCHNLAMAYQFTGRVKQSVKLYRFASKLVETPAELHAIFCNLAETLRLSGSLRESEATIRKAKEYFPAVMYPGNFVFSVDFSLLIHGLIMSTRGMYDNAKKYFQQVEKEYACIANVFLAQQSLWIGDSTDAFAKANRAWETALNDNVERNMIFAARFQGATALYMNNLNKAEEWLTRAVNRARSSNDLENELWIMLSLAELRRRQKDLKAARELLDDVWEYAERGPYPLFHADAFNVLAQIERDAGNNTAAVDAATKAYRLAWCDGEPYAYHWGLVAARKHLRELGAPEPEMPPFDASKYEPMPEVEINPKDEFYVEPTKDQ